MRTFPYHHVIATAMKTVPDLPKASTSRCDIDLQKQSVVAGCALEIPATPPSLPEIGEAMGIAHSTVHDAVKRWRCMYWQDRNGWLTFVHGRLCDEANALDAAVRG